MRLLAFLLEQKMLELKVNIAGFDQVIQAIGATERQVKTAAVRAINKTAIWAQSKSAREISAETKIKLKLIRQRLRLIKANSSSLKAFILAKLYGVPAAKLGNSKQDARGSSIAGHNFPGAFIAKMPRSGHVGIYKRKTSKRLPIKEQHVQIDPPASDIIKKNIDDEAAEIFMKYFKHELDYATRIAQ
jgi:hypothetical protein